MYYFLAIVEKEYEKIYNDVIISKDYNIISYSYDIQSKGYYEKKDLKNITKFGIYESTEYEFMLKI